VFCKVPMNDPDRRWKTVIAIYPEKRRCATNQLVDNWAHFDTSFCPAAGFPTP
jgi:hypothetical protein